MPDQDNVVYLESNAVPVPRDDTSNKDLTDVITQLAHAVERLADTLGERTTRPGDANPKQAKELLEQLRRCTDEPVFDVSLLPRARQPDKMEGS
jgi:hypothetical protein